MKRPSSGSPQCQSPVPHRRAANGRLSSKYRLGTGVLARNRNRNPARRRMFARTPIQCGRRPPKRAPPARSAMAAARAAFRAQNCRGRWTFPQCDAESSPRRGLWRLLGALANRRFRVIVVVEIADINFRVWRHDIRANDDVVTSRLCENQLRRF